MIPAPDPRTVFIRGLVLAARIGVYASEQTGPQRIGVDLEFDVADPGGVGPDDLARVVDYSAVVDLIRSEVAARHTKLVETLAERLAHAVLADPRIVEVRLRVTKLDIYPDSTHVGVEIRRRRAVAPVVA